MTMWLRVIIFVCGENVRVSVCVCAGILVCTWLCAFLGMESSAYIGIGVYIHRLCDWDIMDLLSDQRHSNPKNVNKHKQVLDM